MQCLGKIISISVVMACAVFCGVDKSEGSEQSQVVSWGNQKTPNAPLTELTKISAGGSYSLALKSNGTIVGWGYNNRGVATPPAGNNYAAVAAGEHHCLALKTNRTIVGWGSNTYGQATPPAGNNYKALAAGGLHSLALKMDGTLVGWGCNWDGQATPPAGDGFIAVAAGEDHSLALHQNKSIIGFGQDNYGQATPPWGNYYTAIAAGDEHNLALKLNGSIVGWGRNNYGQATPPTGYDYIAIAAGESFSLALKSDGTIVGWGNNEFGQATPPAGNDYIAIAAGGSHGLALKADDTVVGWGYNRYGQAIPPTGNDYIDLAIGQGHSLALKADGTIFGWGSNVYGQSMPPAGNDYIAIAAGEEHSLALKADRTILGWGRNDQGQATPPTDDGYIALAARDNYSLALKDNGTIVGWGDNEFGQATPPGGCDFIAIAAGGIHGLALKTDGTIVGWGNNYYGQATPPAGNDFIAISAGGRHSLALKADGTILGWGRNDQGQATPPAGNYYIAISAGRYYDLALKADMTIVGWGENYYGQATPPTGDDYYVIIAAGEIHSMALRGIADATIFKIEPESQKVYFAAKYGAPNPGDQLIKIWNSQTGALNWEIDYTCSWLTVNPAKGSCTEGPNEVTLSVDMAGLDSGKHNCTLIISDPCALNSPRVLEVNLHVIGPIIELSRSKFEINALEGGANPQDEFFTLTNDGGGTLNWQIENDCNWLAVEPTSGSSTLGDPGETIALRVDITDLEKGDYQGELIISDPCAENSPQMIDVTLHVVGPILELSETEFEFAAPEGGESPHDQFFTIGNDGGGTLNWQCNYECDWLTAEPAGGSLTVGDPVEPITLRVDSSDLETGDYHCQLIISDPCALNSPQIIDVTLHIIGPTLELSQSEIIFVALLNGANPPDQYFSLRNAWGGTLNWQISYDCDWLTVAPTSGSRATGAPGESITLRADAADLELGAYNCELIVSDPLAANSPQIVTVHLYIVRELYVPQDYPTIQDAIDDANDFDAVIVADGAYSGRGNCDINYWGKAITVRSRNGPKNCIIDPNGSEITPRRGFYFCNGEDAYSVLDGFTITNGYSASRGGGIYCLGSSPTISNCIFHSNRAVNLGGGIACAIGSFVALNHCTFNNNLSQLDGGGVGIYKDCRPAISNCTFTNNSAVYGGGGIFSFQSNITLTECTIIGNRAGYGGGLFSNNMGAAMINNCTVGANAVDSYGGGICLYMIDSAMIGHCVINGNRAASGGGLCNLDHDNLLLTHCTFAENIAAEGAGLACNSFGSLSRIEANNCILWDGDGEAWEGTNSTLEISYSNIQGGWPGIGNVDIEPNFVDPGHWEDPYDTPDDTKDDIFVGGDYHLKSQAGRWNAAQQTWVKDEETSTCIDAGDPAGDATAELWPHGGRINMGTYGGTAQASMSLSQVGNIADLNHDGAVDLKDWDLFGAKWKWQKALLAADLDRNGIVDERDLYVFVSNWLWK